MRPVGEVNMNMGAQLSTLSSTAGVRVVCPARSPASTANVRTPHMRSAMVSMAHRHTAPSLDMGKGADVLPSTMTQTCSGSTTVSVTVAVTVYVPMTYSGWTHT